MPLKGRKKVDKALKQTKIKASDDIRGVYLSGLSVIIKQTPVADGGAKNNWFFTVGMPFTLTSGRGEDTSGSGSQRSLSELPEHVLNKKMFFTNNLPYIETLEYGGYPKPGSGEKTTAGYSNQVAPDGWVRKTIKAMAKKIREL